MKKSISILFAFLLLFSFTACTPASLGGGSNTQKPEFVPSSKASVVSSFLVENEAKFTVALAENANVKTAGIACMYFDATGKLLVDYEVLSCSIDNEAISSWETKAPTGCAYTVATIAFTTDASGNKETCPNLDVWADETEAKFTVDSHKAQIAAWTQHGAKAETCEYIKIDEFTCTDETLKIKVTNLTNQDIPVFHIYILLFDKDGKPLSAGGNTCPNSKLIELKNLRAEETATYNYTVPAETATAKGVIRMIQLGDNKTWNNDYVYEWLFSNYNIAPAK